MKIKELLQEAQITPSSNSETFEYTVSCITHFAPKVEAIKVTLTRANLIGLKVSKVKKMFLDRKSNGLAIELSGKLPFNKQEFEHQIERIYEIIEQHNAIDIREPSSSKNLLLTFIALETLPSSPIEWPNILISNTEKSLSSLANIDKLLKVSDTLIIGNIDTVKSNVLGLFRLGAKDIQLKPGYSISSNDEIEWIQTVEKYLGNKDMISCQEELMDKGLAEYAKK